MNKRLIAAGVLLNLLLIAAGGFLLYKDLKTDIRIDFPEDEIIVYRGQGDDEDNGFSQADPGIYVDYSYDGDRIYLGTPSFHLPAGIYTAAVTHTVDDSRLESRVYEIECAHPSWRYVKSDTVNLNGKNAVSTYRFYVSGERDCILTNRFYGRIVPDGTVGYALVQGVSIERGKKASALWTFGKLLAIFIVINSAFAILISEGLRSLILRNRMKIFFVLLVAIVASYPMLTDYGIFADDLDAYQTRIEGLAKGIEAGTFPVKIQPFWLSDRGYAESVMYGDWLLYPAAFLRILQVPVYQTGKAYMAFINLLTTIVCLWVFFRLFKQEKVAYLATVIYVLYPQRLFDLYVRSAVGEYSAAIFSPLVLLGFYEILNPEEQDGQEKRGLFDRRGIIPLGIGLAGVVTTHFLTTYFVVVCIFVTCIKNIRKIIKKDVFFALAKAACLAIVLSLGFLVPFLDFSRLPMQVFYDESTSGYIQENGLFVAELFTTIFGKEFPNHIRGMFGGVIISAGLISAVIPFLIFFDLLKRKKTNPQALSFTLAGLFAMWMATNTFPYDFINDLFGSSLRFFTVIQYPYRLLILTSLFFSAALGFFIADPDTELPSVNRDAWILLLVGISVVQTLNFGNTLLNLREPIRPIDTAAVKDHYSNMDYLPLGTDISKIPRGSAICASDHVSITSEQKYNRIRMDIVSLSDRPETIKLPLIWYPYYKGKDAVGDRFEVYSGEGECAMIDIPAGYSGEIRVAFEEPLLWRVAELISLLVVILLLPIWRVNRTLRK